MFSCLWETRDEIWGGGRVVITTPPTLEDGPVGSTVRPPDTSADVLRVFRKTGIDETEKRGRTSRLKNMTSRLTMFLVTLMEV